jgi:hypothetical protein
MTGNHQAAVEVEGLEIWLGLAIQNQVESTVAISKPQGSPRTIGLVHPTVILFQGFTAN